jgi:glycine/D-amino acid oxidase-like deaminating enzyme/nitrite reductase/ring-hydroxylating ferredoxin subunit
MKENFWADTAKSLNLSRLTGRKTADVAIVGAGITGLTTAYLLTEAGKKVIVIEAGTLEQSATAKSSAHLTTESDYHYSRLASEYDPETARAVAGSRTAAVSFIAGLSKLFPCDFKFVPGYLYSESRESELEDEYTYASEAGLEVSLATGKDLPLPFPVSMAIEFRNQAIFHPVKYLTGMAEYLVLGGVCEIYGNSRVKSRNKNELTTLEGTVVADEIVYATHYPIFIDLHQTLVYPYRSYMISALVGEDIGDSLFWDTAEPYRYTRTYDYGDKKYILVGGADHKTGHQSKNSYQELENYLRERYTVKQVTGKWSSQYYEPADGLPYIGKSYSGNEYIATGFSGDGLVYGTLAGIAISEAILGLKDKTWHKVYDAGRVNVVKSAGKFVSENLDVASDLVKDHLRPKGSDNEESLQKGQGMVIKKDGRNLAVSRDSKGLLRQVSAVCPHMKCLVRWNQLDESWDCPCHGSRFTPSGKVITGPAVSDLEDVPSNKQVLK